MTRKHQPESKISLGSPSAKTITKRAHELAEIEHPQAPNVRKSDRKQAHREMTDPSLSIIADDGKSRGRRTTNPQDPYAETGRENEPVIEESEQEQVESMARDGVEEASHDQMIKSRG